MEEVRLRSSPGVKALPTLCEFQEVRVSAIVVDGHHHSLIAMARVSSLALSAKDTHRLVVIHSNVKARVGGPRFRRNWTAAKMHQNKEFLETTDHQVWLPLWKVK